MDFSQIGQQFGLSPAQTQAAFEALAPALGAGLQRNGSGNDVLGGLLQQLGAAQASGGLSNPDILTKSGNDVLGQIFGSKDVSRGVAAKASQATGIGADLLKKMLPIFASIVMAQLAKQMTGSAQTGTGGGGLGDILGQVLGGAGGGGQQGGGLGGILGQVLGGAMGGGGQQGGGLGGILGQVLGGAGGGEDLLRSIEASLRK
jgi:hypothetical protein